MQVDSLAAENLQLKDKAAEAAREAGRQSHAQGSDSTASSQAALEAARAHSLDLQKSLDDAHALLTTLQQAAIAGQLVRPLPAAEQHAHGCIHIVLEDLRS